MKPQITKVGILDCQVCVPDHWDDAQITEFAECGNPSGTTNGWQIRKEGDSNLLNNPERNPCEDREGFVHIMLDA